MEAIKRRDRKNRGQDDSVEVDLLLDNAEDVKISLAKIEERLTEIEKTLETMKGI
jgi:hypothetical protein